MREALEGALRQLARSTPTGRNACISWTRPTTSGPGRCGDPLTTLSTGTGTATCPSCGADGSPGATFCEACAFEFGDVLGDGAATTAGPPDGGLPPAPSFPPTVVAEAAATPVTAPRGEESPLDVGWTGPVTRGTAIEAEPRPPSRRRAPPSPPVLRRPLLRGVLRHLGGSKEPDPRDHFSEEPAPWVGGVCDIGRRHRRNEDAMALAADPASASFAVLVVCDGVSNTTDSHIASLAASRAAREVLRAPIPQGVGTPSSFMAAAERRLADAVIAANQSVEETTVPVTRPLKAHPRAPCGSGRRRPDGGHRQRRRQPGVLAARRREQRRRPAERGRLVRRRADERRYAAQGGRDERRGARDHALARGRRSG